MKYEFNLVLLLSAHSFEKQRWDMRSRLLLLWGSEGMATGGTKDTKPADRLILKVVMCILCFLWQLIGSGVAAPKAGELCFSLLSPVKLAVGWADN